MHNARAPGSSWPAFPLVLKPAERRHTWNIDVELIDGKACAVLETLQIFFNAHNIQYTSKLSPANCISLSGSSTRFYDPHKTMADIVEDPTSVEVLPEVVLEEEPDQDEDEDEFSDTVQQKS